MNESTNSELHHDSFFLDYELELSHEYSKELQSLLYNSDSEPETQDLSIGEYQKLDHKQLNSLLSKSINNLNSLSNPSYLPDWLSPESEVKSQSKKYVSNESWGLNYGKFVEICVDGLLSQFPEMNLNQALGITANSLNETGLGRYYRGNNLGGWKITKGYAKFYLSKFHKPTPYWKAKGNKGSGDPDWVFYRAFDSIKEYLKEWVLLFTPKHNQPNKSKRYSETGIQFWSNPESQSWFEYLIQAGYKGPVTKAHPQGSIKSHSILFQSALIRYLQQKLKVTPDGKFGPHSLLALQSLQSKLNLPISNSNKLTDPSALSTLQYLAQQSKLYPVSE